MMECPVQIIMSCAGASLDGEATPFSSLLTSSFGALAPTHDWTSPEICQTKDQGIGRDVPRSQALPLMGNSYI